MYIYRIYIKYQTYLTIQLNKINLGFSGKEFLHTNTLLVN